MASNLKTRYTVRERRAIANYLREMERSADNAVDKARRAKQADPTDMSKRTWEYWKNVRAGFRWAAGLLKQAEKT